MIAAWASFVGTNPGLQDPQSDAVAEANRLVGGERVTALLALLDAELARDPAIVKLIEDLSMGFPRAEVPARAAASGTAA